MSAASHPPILRRCFETLSSPLSASHAREGEPTPRHVKAVLSVRRRRSRAAERPRSSTRGRGYRTAGSRDAAAARAAPCGWRSGRRAGSRRTRGPGRGTSRRSAGGCTSWASRRTLRVRSGGRARRWLAALGLGALCFELGAAGLPSAAGAPPPYAGTAERASLTVGEQRARQARRVSHNNQRVGEWSWSLPRIRSGMSVDWVDTKAQPGQRLEQVRAV